MATITNTNGSQTLSGTSDSDTLIGGNGTDTLSGGDGNDILDGGNGNDILDGGSGDDTIYGGNGNDIFIYKVTENIDLNNTTSDYYDGQNGKDTLRFILTDQQMADLTNSGAIAAFNASNKNIVFNFETYVPYLDLKVIHIEKIEFLLAANTAPVAVEDVAIVSEDGSSLVSVLTNDFDPDAGNTISLFSITSSTAGVTVTPIGNQVHYNPGTHFDYLSAGEYATDTFTYVIKDQAGTQSSPATVTMTINGMNDTPVAEADKTLTLAEDVTINLNIAAPTDVDMHDVLTITVTAVPTHGSIMKADNTLVVLNNVLSSSELQGLKFIPDANFSGNPGDFTYEVKDLANVTDTQTIHFDVAAVADTPNLTVIDATAYATRGGFYLNGIAADDRSGFSVSAAGDINHDGIGDLIIGVYLADPNGSNSGQSYVIFGDATLPAWADGTLDLSDLNGTNGFQINGIAADDVSGFSVSAAGDINHDGIGDLIIGAYLADPNGSGSGQSYVIFGDATSPAWANGTLDLSDSNNLNGTNGFKINGIAPFDASGFSVSAAGDINHDGIGDLIIGASQADPNGSNSGQSYVIFGDATLPAWANGTLNLSDLNGTNGFKINGIAPFDGSGFSVSAAGDINHDGIGDLIIGASQADPNGSGSGQSYVIFGDATSPAWANGTLDLSDLNGTNGFKINGIAADDRSGFSVSAAGDINHDGIGDLIIGASQADPNGSNSGQSYVIFGDATLPAWADGTLDLSDLNGTNGFKINGIAPFDASGFLVSAAGDINHDGIGDLIIGAYLADPNGSGSGQSYVIFGDATSPAWADGTLDLSDLNGTNGFKINGIAAGDGSGFSVSAAGDINHDGIGDLIIGAYRADPNGSDSGQSYVVFGHSGPFDAVLELSHLLDLKVDSTIPLNITTSLNDTDGSETLALTLSNLPTGSTLNLGTTVGQPSGTWLIDADHGLNDLSTLAITVEPGQDDFTLTVMATAMETSNLSTATITHNLFVDMPFNHLA